ncbi:hypothetical protein AALP_AA6G115400 [Arabis alpina]|uniref:ADP-ribosyl cyclase/cyclic ADP-ribose hydrolase n=1 Tax=Arabis alpina TaxID=50452 RepID=A0A087GNL3_ARAAL|nr:hypothetical protein AALP_AA6G115400 [Arabis alpina]
MNYFPFRAMDPFSSSSSRNWLYDVFPSFSGEDVRQNILSHFLKELDRKSIIAFIDNGIERGRSLDPELKKAIKDSRIAVVVFSKHYASSSWCLNELLEIVRCKKELDQVVIPIFYGLDPSDVRKQTGDFGKNFDKTCKNKSKEEKNRWQKALTDVADLTGYHSRNWLSEATMIDKIVNDVGNLLNSNPPNDFEGFVGIEDHISKMRLLLDLESEEVKMVGIWGTSGIGKTTIASALFHRLSRHFESRLFIDRGFVSRSTNTDDYNMKLHLQEKFLSNLLGKEGIVVDHLGAVREKLKHRKVLIVIDHLDDLMVLDTLVGGEEWFGRGSRIIVITNDKHLLTAHGIDCIYEVGLPSEELALEMFCRSAFRQNSPPEDFKELVVEAVRLAGNLPLGLNVLGSSFRCRDKNYWMDMLRKLHSRLNGKIEKVLRVGYDGLDSEDDKAIFHHIACLFNLEKVSDIKLLLADSDLNFEIGLKNLVDKSLVHVRLNIVEMHPLLQKLGMEIVREQSINPGKREFLVDWKDICDVLEENTGTRKVLGISLNMDEIDELLIHEDAFKNMRNLRFLTIFSNKYMPEKTVRLYLPDSFDHLPPKLKLLCWDGYPMKSLPSKFRPESLVKLKMKDSKLKKLWEGTRKLTCLKEMNLWGSENLKEIPDLSRATNLERLYLAYCLSWVQLPSSIRKFNELTSPGMLECRNLETLPTGGINTESPKRLILRESSHFEGPGIKLENSTTLQEKEEDTTNFEDMEEGGIELFHRE